MSPQNKNKFLSAVKYAFTIAAIFVFAGSVSAVTPAVNPALSGTCGWNIALVLDNSSSIGNTNLGIMKSTFITFVNNLIPSTQSQFSVTYFNTTATIVQSLSGDKDIITDSIQNKVPSANDYTNWQDGLAKAQSTNPNLVILASDGQPNRYGNPAQGSGSNTSQPVMDAAVTTANSIKAGGARIITLGIGSNIMQDNMEAISSADAYYSVSSFADLPAFLNSFIADNCGSTILKCASGETKGCSSGRLGICANGTQTCASGNIWGECVASAAGSMDCSSPLDNNCDGTADNLQCGGPSVTICGDGTCNGAETCSTCLGDCGQCVQTPIYPWCGDHICNNGEACSTCPGDCGVCSAPGGSGNGTSSASFYIFNEQITSASIGSDNVTVTWETNKSSNSRVIYGAYNESHTYNSGLVNYGYAKISAEDSAQTTNHLITLTGLKSGIVYYVRGVSLSGSELAISKELTFTTKAVAGVTTQSAPQEEISGTQDNNPGTLAVEETVPQQVAGAQDTNAAQEQAKRGFLASAGDFIKFNLWYLIILAALFFFWFLITKRNRRVEENQ
jgi:hypothetical protein